MNARGSLLKAKELFDAGNIEQSTNIARAVWLKTAGLPKSQAAHLLMLNYVVIGDLVKATAFFRQAYIWLNRDPVFLVNAAILRTKQKQYQNAIDLCRQALAIRPDYADAFFIMGQAFDEFGFPHEAIAQYNMGLQIEDRPQIHTNKGNSLETLGRRDEALSEHYAAMAGAPDAVEPYLNVASIAMKRRDYRYCKALYEKVIGINPQNGPARMGLAQIELLAGNWESGWYNYSWRFHAAGTAMRYPWPQWKGFDELDPNLRLLVVFEQGYGDSFMGARYLPALQSVFGRNLVLNCPKDLQPIIDRCHAFGHSPQPFRYLDIGSTTKLAKSFDRYIHLMDLFRVFGLSNYEVLRYMNVDPFSADDRKPNIGFCWRGRSIPDPKRTIPFEQFKMLLQSNDCCKVKLQQDATIKETLMFNVGINDRSNWIETARTIDSCDFIVTIDTSIAHVAGALGKPCFVLVPYSADWRWGDPAKGAIRPAPFYSNMVVYQQTEENDWTETLKIVNERLLAYIAVNTSARNEA